MKTTALPSPAPTRPRTLIVGASLGTGAVAIAFCSLVSLYVQQRQLTLASEPEWFPINSIEMGPAGMVMVTLIMSMITIQWAVQAARAEDRPHGFLALGVTLMLGAAAINQFWFIYQNTGLAIDESNAALLFYAVTGSFLAILGTAMLCVALVTIRSLLGTCNSELADIIQTSAVFWHATVLCYGLVWYVVFITK